MAKGSDDNWQLTIDNPTAADSSDRRMYGRMYGRMYRPILPPARGPYPWSLVARTPDHPCDPSHTTPNALLEATRRAKGRTELKNCNYT